MELGQVVFRGIDRISLFCFGEAVQAAEPVAGEEVLERGEQVCERAVRADERNLPDILFSGQGVPDGKNPDVRGRQVPEGKLALKSVPVRRDRKKVNLVRV